MKVHVYFYILAVGNQCEMYIHVYKCKYMYTDRIIDITYISHWKP